MLSALLFVACKQSAVATERAERDPIQDLRGALSSFKTKYLTAQTDPKGFGKLLRTIEGYEGTLIVRCAIRLAPLVFVRPGELRHAEWVDINFEEGEWRYTVTKTNTPHIVPLSTQALAILQEIHPLTATVAMYSQARAAIIVEGVSHSILRK